MGTAFGNGQNETPGTPHSDPETPMDVDSRSSSNRFGCVGSIRKTGTRCRCVTVKTAMLLSPNPEIFNGNNIVTSKNMYMKTYTCQEQYK